MIRAINRLESFHVTPRASLGSLHAEGASHPHWNSRAYDISSGRSVADCRGGAWFVCSVASVAGPAGRGRGGMGAVSCGGEDPNFGVVVSSAPRGAGDRCDRDGGLRFASPAATSRDPSGVGSETAATPEACGSALAGKPKVRPLWGGVSRAFRRGTRRLCRRRFGFGCRCRGER
jgi:hypothetical protein